MTEQPTRVLVSGGIEAPDPAIPGVCLGRPVELFSDSDPLEVHRFDGTRVRPAAEEPRDAQVVKCPGGCACRGDADDQAAGFDGDDEPTLPAATVAVLSPGDRVLLMTAATVNMAEVEEWRTALSQAFPGVFFMIIGGMTGAMVLPGACAETPQED